jgi:hypothetical protein
MVDSTVTDLEVLHLFLDRFGYQEKSTPGYREYYVTTNGPHIQVGLSLGIVFLFTMDGRSIPRSRYYHMKRPKVEIIRITPNQATRWIEHNIPKNRKLRRAKVAQYAADMVNGRWRLSNDAISFDSHGMLVNGQHRLHACVKSGVAILSILLWNIPTESFAVLDSGMLRTTDDRFRMTGHEYPYGFGATVRRLFLSVRLSRSRAFTDLEVGDFMERHASAVRYAHQMLPHGRMANAALRAPIVRAYILKASSRRLEQFAHVLITGLQESRADAAAVLLRNYILDTVATHSGARKSIYLYAEAALDHFLKGVGVMKLTPNTVELFPLPGESEWFDDLQEDKDANINVPTD